MRVGLLKLIDLYTFILQQIKIKSYIGVKISVERTINDSDRLWVPESASPLEGVFKCSTFRKLL